MVAQFDANSLEEILEYIDRTIERCLSLGMCNAAEKWVRWRAAVKEVLDACQS